MNQAKKKKIYILLALLVIIIAILTFNVLIFGYGMLEYYFDVSFSIIIIILCFLIFWRVGEQQKPQTDFTEKEVEDFTSKVFHSNSFINAFETSLPKGEGDEELGLDYIPYMLKNIELRRERFTKSSNRFLSITIFLGIIFIGITVWFGYILINEDQIGTQRIINRIDNKLTTINSYLDLQNEDIFTNERFIELCQEKLSLLESLNNQEEGKLPIRAKVNSTIRDIKKSNNPLALRDSLSLFISEAPRETNDERFYVNKIEDFQTSYLTFLREKEGSYALLIGNINRFEKDLVELKATINKPDNRLAEMIKRLILSLVIISFFIAILRYAAGLYNSHLTEMIKIEKEDLVIRKFYVILKSMNKDSEEKSKLLTEFLLRNQSDNVDDSDSKMSKDEISILRNVVDSLIKKI